MASKNSNNRLITHYKSTDALLGTSSDDFLLHSTENLVDPINTVTAEYGDTQIKFSSNENIPSNDDSKHAERYPDEAADEYLHSNSTTNLLSNIDTVYSIQINEPCTAKPPSINVKRKSMHKETDPLLIKHTDSKHKESRYDPNDCDADNQRMDFDVLNEKMMLHRERFLATDVQKRNHSLVRPPISYRFSAGDADKLEKGIKHIPSTRSLREK